MFQVNCYVDSVACSTTLQHIDQTYYHIILYRTNAYIQVYYGWDIVIESIFLSFIFGDSWLCLISMLFPVFGGSLSSILYGMCDTLEVEPFILHAMHNILGLEAAWFIGCGLLSVSCGFLFVAVVAVQLL